ncbi:cathepsin O-like [Dermatophagoides pteronyssinus]|uniref:cathepsin O-like n=1 Tax=Dermatophagoides pteronyssinus TaxID=6956 RepID=UPI003F66D512
MSKLFFKLLYMISIISIINTEYCPKHLQSTSNSLRSSIDNHPTLSSTLMKSTEQINQLGNSYSLDDIDQCYDGTYGDQKIDLFNMSINEIVHDYFMSVQTLHGTMNNDKHETEKRLQIVAENINSLIKAIEECLRKPKNQRIRLGITSFTHLTDQEFDSMINHHLIERSTLHATLKGGLGSNLTGTPSCPNEPISRQLPRSFNWFEQGKVTPIRQQGQCGSCFIFSSVATVESSLLIKSNGQINPYDVDFSEQAVLDCLARNTCESGGYQWFGWSTMAQYGIVDEEYYPYQTQWLGQCNVYPRSRYRIRVIDWCSHNYNNDEIIQTMLYKYGPLDASISVSTGPEWKYLKGPFEAYCDTHVNHAVTLIGWDEYYWIIKNSWGPEWGINGYLFLPRHSNKCGILIEVAMPITEIY